MLRKAKFSICISKTSIHFCTTLVERGNRLIHIFMTLNSRSVLFANASKNVSLLVSLETKCYDAFNYGRREEALRLLKEVKDPHIVKSKSNFTILHCAAHHGWLDVVKELIIEHQFHPGCKDDDGNTSLA